MTPVLLMPFPPDKHQTLTRDFDQFGLEKFGAEWNGDKEIWRKALVEYGRELEAGRITIYALEDGSLRAIPTKYWRTWNVDERLAAYLIEPDRPYYVPQRLEGGAKTTVGVVVAIGASQALPNSEDVYLSPFILMMLEAVKQFEITAQSAVKHETLLQHFSKQKLPDGRPISANQARYLATFCRPPDAMKGGNKRMG